MIMEGQFTLNAPIDKVWSFLLDPGVLASAIPGSQKMVAIDDKTYESEVKQKVGPISVTLKFTTTLTEVVPPKHIKAVGRGADITKAGTFTQDTTVDLKEISKDETQVSYTSNVALVGRLATFGERIMRAKAKSVSEEFTKNLQERLKANMAK